MWSLILSDLRAKASIYEHDSLLRALFTDSASALVLYRLMQWCQRRRLSLVAAFVSRLIGVVSHAVIGRGADFGPGLVILHSVGVVINTRVRGGRGIVIGNGATIGERHGRGVPLLGDNVYIGAGAKILGAVRIGSNVRVGANAVVLDDVADGMTVVGIPARVARERIDAPLTV